MSEAAQPAEATPRRHAAMRPAFTLAAMLAAVIATAAAFVAFIPACTAPTNGATEQGALETFAGIPPVAYLVKRIGGPRVRVEVLLTPGRDEHTFEPTSQQVARLGKIRLLFKIGMPFEEQLTERIAAGNTRITMVDVGKGIERRESDEDDDEHGGADPHIWLAPRLLKQMAANIAEALIDAEPPHESEFRANLAALDTELDALDRHLAASLSPFHGEAFYVFHPAFGYFADAYGLRQESVEVEGKQPTPRQLFRMIQRARADHVRIIFLQPQFNQQAAASIADALGGAVMPMDSLAYDVVANLDDIAKKIAARKVAGSLRLPSARRPQPPARSSEARSFGRTAAGGCLLLCREDRP